MTLACNGKPWVKSWSCGRRGSRWAGQTSSFRTGAGLITTCSACPRVVLTAMQDDQERVLLILRYRFIPGTWGWGLPSGLADPAEDFAAAAARETLNETGWEPESPELLPRLEASAGLTDSVQHVYQASRARRRGEPGFETVRMEWFPLGDMPAMIASGEIRAASTSAVLMIGSANKR
jgi:8-oxo-dGTP pyrophosphatase MutT (NUDIX family)